MLKHEARVRVTVELDNQSCSRLVEVGTASLVQLHFDQQALKSFYQNPLRYARVLEDESGREGQQSQTGAEVRPCYCTPMQALNSMRVYSYRYRVPQSFCHDLWGGSGRENPKGLDPFRPPDD